MESEVRQGFGEAVGDHLFGWNVRELDSFSSHFFAKVAGLDVNMFCPGVKNRVVGYSYGALIVTLQWNGNAWWRFSPPPRKQCPGPDESLEHMCFAPIS